MHIDFNSLPYISNALHVDLNFSPIATSPNDSSNQCNEPIDAHTHQMISRRKLANNSSLDSKLAYEINNLKTREHNQSYLATLSHIEPIKNYRIALTQPHWKNAMDDKISVLLENHTWSSVPRPYDSNIIIGSKWMFKIKHKEDGTIDRNKAHLIAQG